MSHDWKIVAPAFLAGRTMLDWTVKAAQGSIDNYGRLHGELVVAITTDTKRGDYRVVTSD